MKKLMLSLFIAFGLSACSLNNDDFVSNCGNDAYGTFTGFPLSCNYTLKSPSPNPASYIIESQERMDVYFTKNENSCAGAPDPNIDYSKNILVGIVGGQKPTTGYALKITTIIENNCAIIVNFHEKSPLTGEVVNQTPTYPSDFILLPKNGKTIIFNKTNDSFDNVVIGSFSNQCTGADCQNFMQITDFNISKFLNVKAGIYDFSQYKYTSKAKSAEYTLFLKNVPAEILALKGQTKTYGTPDASSQGGVYFELRQGINVTKVYIDNNDTQDQSTEVKAFKKAIKDELTSLK